MCHVKKKNIFHKMYSGLIRQFVSYPYFLFFLVSLTSTKSILVYFRTMRNTYQNSSSIPVTIYTLKWSCIFKLFFPFYTYKQSHDNIELWPES